MNSLNDPRMEYKWILNCAIEGMEHLMGLLSAERVHETIQGHFEFAGRAIVLSGGEVARNSGLGVLGLFNTATSALDAARVISLGSRNLSPSPDCAGISLCVTITLGEGQIFRGQIGGREFLEGPALMEIRDMVAMTSIYALDILATEGFYNGIENSDGFRRIDQMKMERGGTSKLFEFFAHQDVESRDYKRKWDLVFQQALTDYFGLNIEAAVDSFRRLTREAPRGLVGRGLLEIYLARCEDQLHGKGNSDYLLHSHCAGIINSGTNP